MQELKVIGVESGALVVATDAGSEFRLPVTLSLQSQLRAADPERSLTKHRVPPREIQASIRAGHTAEEVAQRVGVDIDYVRRFEGPVLAEREFVLASARGVLVSVIGEPGSASETASFGSVIDLRLDGADATDREWTSFKDPADGWIVRVAYTTQEVEREATWRFDPKKQGLAPHGGDALTLSRQDGGTSPLVPRLRAVGDIVRSTRESRDDGLGTGVNDSGRFDSGAFEVDDVSKPELVQSGADSAPAADRLRNPASVAAANRAPDEAPAHNQTADLLEALRRRRGEREAARFDGEGDARAAHPSANSIRAVDIPLDDFTGLETSEPLRDTKPLATHPTASRLQQHHRAEDPSDVDDISPSGAPSSPARSSGGRDTGSRDTGRRDASSSSRPSRTRKGRASMPSWDEIVFGARSDDDPA